MSLPDFVIIGAARCGTTTLHRCLGLHPEIGMAQIKEPEFFLETRNWTQGLAWYEALFPEHVKLRGEASTSYTKYPAFGEGAALMHSVIPQARLIYLVRDPLEQMVSHYVHTCLFFNERLSFADALNGKEGYFPRCASFAYQLEQYLRYYPKEQICLIELQDLISEPQALLQGVFEFLGVDPQFRHPEFEAQLNSTKEHVQEHGKWEILRDIPGNTELVAYLQGKISAVELTKDLNLASLIRSVRRDKRRLDQRLRPSSGLASTLAAKLHHWNRILAD